MFIRILYPHSGYYKKCRFQGALQPGKLGSPPNLFVITPNRNQKLLISKILCYLCKTVVRTINLSTLSEKDFLATTTKPSKVLEIEYFDFDRHNQSVSEDCLTEDNDKGEWVSVKKPIQIHVYNKRQTV